MRGWPLYHPPSAARFARRRTTCIPSSASASTASRLRCCTRSTSTSRRTSSSRSACSATRARTAMRCSSAFARELGAAPVQHLGKLLIVWRAAPKEPAENAPPSRATRPRENPRRGKRRRRDGPERRCRARRRGRPASKSPLELPAESRRRRRGAETGKPAARGERLHGKSASHNLPPRRRAAPNRTASRRPASVERPALAGDEKPSATAARKRHDGVAGAELAHVPGGAVLDALRYARRGRLIRAGGGKRSAGPDEAEELGLRQRRPAQVALELVAAFAAQQRRTAACARRPRRSRSFARL